MVLKINIDVEKIAADFKELATEVEQDLTKGVSNLAAMTHAKVAEMANQELKSTRKKFSDSLGFEEIAPGIWVVSVDEKGLWIEDGIEANTDMKPNLLKEGASVSKEGYKYKPIPFDYGKGPSQMTPYTQHVVSLLRYELKKKKIPFKKIEKNANGSPRIGKLHTLNFEGGKPTPRASTDVLKGVNIYQSLTKTGNVRRDILTFRTVSDGPKSKGKWIHPGLPPKHFLERAQEWALKEWEQNVLPQILEKFKG